MALVESALTFNTSGAIGYPALHQHIIELGFVSLENDACSCSQEVASRVSFACG